MNRWWGSASDSDKQAADRNSRAARRTINQLPAAAVVSDSDDEYTDCDTSGLIFNVDGGDDADIMAAEAQAAAAELARQKALPVAQSDYENDEDAWKKEIRLKFDIHDVEYWFNSVESLMKKYGINRQWDKKSAIVPCLPDEVVEECKPILRLSEEDAGPSIYGDLKKEILSLYGPKEEDAFQQAMALKMVGKPSALGKQLIHKICPGAKPFNNCHCARIVYGMWVAQLSNPIKVKLAGRKFTADTYKELFQLADDAWSAGGGSQSIPAVVAAVAEAPNPSSNPPTDAQQIAAFSRGRGGRGGRGNRGGRGGRGNNSSRGGRQPNNNYNQNQSSSSNSSNSSNNKPHQKGPKHSDLPAAASWACAQHWKKGRQAPYCSDPLVCEWSQVVAPRQSS